MEGRAVKLVAGTNSHSFRQHVDRFRHSVHNKNKQETIGLITDFLAANQRPDDADTNTFTKFALCDQPNCGFLAPREVLVKKGEQAPKNVFYIWPDMSKVIEDFISENNCTHLMLHRNR